MFPIINQRKLILFCFLLVLSFHDFVIPHRLCTKHISMTCSSLITPPLLSFSLSLSPSLSLSLSLSLSISLYFSHSLSHSLSLSLYFSLSMSISLSISPSLSLSLPLLNACTYYLRFTKLLFIKYLYHSI